MNFKHISHRISLCELRRLKSSLSASNSKIQIPTRIERGPTDILQALESTIPKNSTQSKDIYNDDPYLYPIKRNSYRNYGLSYESGKKIAMWIHKEHRDLFPKHLSDPAIDAFQPPAVYTDKSQVSEEILLQVISQCRASDAVNIYRLLETNVSNQTKQALLELLCFFNDESRKTDIPYFERWYTVKEDTHVQRSYLEINELYQSLIKEDPLTAAAAYNTMICGLAKYSKTHEAFSIYEECKEKDVPINVTTYNYLLKIIPEDPEDKKSEKIVQKTLGILKEMNAKKIKPNVRTLNAALKSITRSPTDYVNDIIELLFSEFQKMNIKFSLATYYYAMRLYSSADRDAYENFKTILYMIEDKNFTFQDPDDSLFFSQAMTLAKRFTDKRAAYFIHDLLQTGNNRIFITNATDDNTYYTAYIPLLLTMCSVTEFFAHYDKIVPHLFVPHDSLFRRIIHDLQCKDPNDVVEYVPKLWSNLQVTTQKGYLSRLECVQLMKIDILPPDSPLRTIFIDAAQSCWNDIKDLIEKRSEILVPIKTEPIAHLMLILLYDKRIEEATAILRDIINEPHLFIPTMTRNQLNELFNTFISEQCPAGALLILEYMVNFGHDNIAEMCTKLCNLPGLTPIDRNKLRNLVGV